MSHFFPPGFDQNQYLQPMHLEKKSTEAIGISQSPQPQTKLSQPKFEQQNEDAVMPKSEPISQSPPSQASSAVPSVPTSGASEQFDMQPSSTAIPYDDTGMDATLSSEQAAQGDLFFEHFIENPEGVS